MHADSPVWSFVEIAAGEASRATELESAPSAESIAALVEARFESALAAEKVRIGMEESGSNPKDLRVTLQFHIRTIRRRDANPSQSILRGTSGRCCNLKITHAGTFMLKVPIRREIADGMQSTSVLEFVGLNISTDEGFTGTGYTITVGAGGSVIKEVLDSLFVDQLTGKNPFNVKEIWYQLYYGKSHWIGRAGATTMAQSAVDIALWDIIAKSSGRPLWQILGGCRSTDIPIYSTAAGWLNRTQDELKNEMLALLADGYTAVKMKVGKLDPREDYRRVKAVRQAIGDDALLMIDANQSWDLMTASVWGKKLEEFNLTWLEEPLHPDDIKAHRSLKQAISIPIALGEHVYTTQSFRDFIENAAVDIIQVDVCRIGGITPWMEVAAMANVQNIRVCPHAGDLMQVHQHLVKAIPNSWYLEVIPDLVDELFENPVQLKQGMCISPFEPGASTHFADEAFRKYRVA